MISAKDIEHLAELARIEVGEGEAKTLAKDVEAILGYVAQVKHISVENGVEKKNGLANVFREDSVPHETGVYTDALLSAVPEREGNFVKVKKIL